MIAKEFEDFLIGHLGTYLIPAKDLAIFIDSHNVEHVTLLLANSGLSRVPVITKTGHYVGTIALGDIMKYRNQYGLSSEQVAKLDIELMVDTRIPTVSDMASLTEVMHKLVDTSFLPVLDKDGVMLGIITRKAILKAINSLLHDFTDHYEIQPK
ncbi:cyclic-di-AMP-binding protein CbpB [Streptococcus caprae]|uniref:Cyclic-di-AMP-binding protein CbpB n=1 Tax=Streptococcus caprae TaxID=1640501 RepID=A0ABV8CXM2_9STRE